jgi:predicted DNA-binding transcriptional regulator AlpA
MVLDLRHAYRRLSLKRSWIYRFITEGWDESLRPAAVAVE